MKSLAVVLLLFAAFVANAQSHEDIVARAFDALDENFPEKWALDDEKFMRSVDGTLQVVKDGHYVAWIRMKNRETVKPGKGVKLETFDTRLEFTPAYEDGPVVPAGVRTEVKGKAFVVVKFNEIETIRYSDIRSR